MSFENHYLNQKQRDTLKKFLSTLAESADDLGEPDSCFTKNYHFEIVPSGIGDSVTVVCGHNRMWLDDGLEG